MELNFDSTRIQPSQGGNDFAAIPKGEYLVQIDETEEKISNAGHKYLNIKLQVIDGQYKNRILWDIVNLWHPKENVKDIAQQTMASICRATNTLKPSTSEELHHKPLRVSVSLEFDSQYGDQNRIKSYMPHGSKPTQPTQPTLSPIRQQVEDISDRFRQSEPVPPSSEATQDDIPF